MRSRPDMPGCPGDGVLVSQVPGKWAAAVFELA